MPRAEGHSALLSACEVCLASWGEFAGLSWPNCDGLIWPTLRPSVTGWSVFFGARIGGRRRDGFQSGAVREDLFKKIRRDREFEGLSTNALAIRYGVHRRTVRQALESAVPPERKPPASRPAPALGPFVEWIDQILIADRTAPRKQRHTAKRIADRLAEEHGVVVAGSTMRDHVRKRRRELGLAAEAFCPQVHDPGVTAEVDWGEATVRLAGVLTVLGLFLMRSCFSGACFVMAFESQCQQAFFEGHVHALDWFTGVFATVRYDNLGSAAKKTLKGRNRVPDGAAELVYQVISERNERGSLIVTTNLPFGEWTKVFPDPRLAKAVVDRITHRAHIIDTGTESWRFRHGLHKDRKRA